nr:MTH938/NDUFAF3 family protein [Cohaesibacter sp. ES.047]
MAAGLEMTEVFYPGHDPIDYYGDGGFRFGTMSHQGALLFLPSGIRRWDVEETPTLQSLAALMKEKDEIEILLIGTGKTLTPPDPALCSAIRAEGIKLDIMDTGAAVRTLNILLSEDRAVAAALLPVD